MAHGTIRIAIEFFHNESASLISQLTAVMSHTGQEIKYIFSILVFLKMSHYTKMISVI